MAKFKLESMWTKALGDAVRARYGKGVNRIEVEIQGGSKVGYELAITTHNMGLRLKIDFNSRGWHELIINNKNRAAVMDLWEQLKDLEFKGREWDFEVMTSAAQQYFEED